MCVLFLGGGPTKWKCSFLLPLKAANPGAPAKINDEPPIVVSKPSSRTWVAQIKKSFAWDFVLCSKWRRGPQDFRFETLVLVEGLAPNHQNQSTNPQIQKNTIKGEADLGVSKKTHPNGTGS